MALCSGIISGTLGPPYVVPGNEQGSIVCKGSIFSPYTLFTASLFLNAFYLFVDHTLHFYWFCTLKLQLLVLRGQNGVQKFELRLAACKASAPTYCTPIVSVPFECFLIMNWFLYLFFVEFLKTTVNNSGVLFYKPVRGKILFRIAL